MEGHTGPIHVIVPTYSLNTEISVDTGIAVTNLALCLYLYCVHIDFLKLCFMIC